MIRKFLPFFLWIMMILVVCDQVYAQQWEFAKERDGIKIYTRKETGNSLKSFKGTADLAAPMNRVTSLLANGKDFDWWDKDITEIKVLAFEPGKLIQYYLVYDVPWPFSDRDLVVETLISVDPVTGIETIQASPLLNRIPEKPGLVRIKKYSQKWVVQPLTPSTTRVTLEGTVDPGGNVPAWLYNMVITDTPLRVVGEVKRRTEKKQ